MKKKKIITQKEEEFLSSTQSSLDQKLTQLARKVKKLPLKNYYQIQSHFNYLLFEFKKIDPIKYVKHLLYIPKHPPKKGIHKSLLESKFYQRYKKYYLETRKQKSDYISFPKTTSIYEFIYNNFPLNAAFVNPNDKDKIFLLNCPEIFNTYSLFLTYIHEGWHLITRKEGFNINGIIYKRKELGTLGRYISEITSYNKEINKAKIIFNMKKLTLTKFNDDALGGHFIDMFYGFKEHYENLSEFHKRYPLNKIAKYYIEHNKKLYKEIDLAIKDFHTIP